MPNGAHAGQPLLCAYENAASSAEPARWSVRVRPRVCGALRFLRCSADHQHATRTSHTHTRRDGITIMNVLHTATLRPIADARARARIAYVQRSPARGTNTRVHTHARTHQPHRTIDKFFWPNARNVCVNAVWQDARRTLRSMGTVLLAEESIL